MNILNAGISFFKSLYEVKSMNILNPSTFEGFDIKGSSHAGVKVNPRTALGHDTVYACIRDKSESIGQLPVRLYRKKGETKELITSGRECRIFTKKPNDYQTMQDFKEMVSTCLELYGRFFAYVSRNKHGNVAEVIPFANQQGVGVNMDANGRLYFTYTTNDGKPFAGYGKDIMHIKLNTLNGFTGLSPISTASRSVGLAIGQEVHLSSLMENGALPKGVLETDDVFKDESALERLKKDWRDKYGGVEKSGETPILENGLKYKPLSITPADAELIKQRQYSKEQLCSIFRVPPERVGVASKEKNVEQSNTAYFRDSLIPIVTKIESAFDEILPESMEIKLDETGFVRGDKKTQVEVESSKFKMGWTSINEARKSMDMQPIEGGDVHAIDTNNLTFGRITDISKLQEEQRALALANSKPEDEPEGEPEGEENES